tara:strand:- start:862 stop:1773 length:912 start_codon:yes stop_codon:yes gene_type:complete
MKKLLLLFTVLFCFVSAEAQDNPFAEYGYTPKIATLSQGQFNESFDNDTIVQIGSVLFNTKSKQIVAFVEYDTLYSEATLEADIVSRWMSPDPLAAHPNQIGMSPYSAMWNNPIQWNDPDGKCPLCPWADAIVDAAFIVYDVAVLAHEKVTTGETSGENWAALTADVASVAVPMSVGAGVAARAAYKAAKPAVKVEKASDVVKAAKKTDEGVVYKRTDNTGNKKDYVGQAKSEDRYKARQKEHARNNPDSEFDFDIIDRGDPKGDFPTNLDIKEQLQLDKLGGPTNKSNPNGGTSNKKNVIKK